MQFQRKHYQSRTYTIVPHQQAPPVKLPIANDLIPSRLIKSDPNGSSWNSVIQTLIEHDKKSDQDLVKLIVEILPNHSDWERIAHAVMEYSQLGEFYGYRLYRLAGLKGSLNAKYKYSQILSRGCYNVPRNQTEAMRIIKQLASQRHLEANYIMAQDALKRKSATEAVGYLRVAADNGHARSQALLGSWYVNGINVPQNYTKGLELLQKSDEQECPDASAALSQVYLTGPSEDRQKAFELAQKAAMAGIASAQHNLALMYFDNDPIPMKNIPFAIENLKMAAFQNYVPSLFMLGMLCIRGHKSSDGIIEVDIERAKKYLGKVVQLNSTYQEDGVFAKKELAKIENTLGISPKNPIE